MLLSVIPLACWIGAVRQPSGRAQAAGSKWAPGSRVGWAYCILDWHPVRARCQQQPPSYCTLSSAGHLLARVPQSAICREQNASLGLTAQQLHTVLGMWLDCSFQAWMPGSGLGAWGQHKAHGLPLAAWLPLMCWWRISSMQLLDEGLHLSSGVPWYLWLVTCACSFPHLSLHAAAGPRGTKQEDQLAYGPTVDELLSVGVHRLQGNRVQLSAGPMSHTMAAWMLQAVCATRHVCFPSLNRFLKSLQAQNITSLRTCCPVTLSWKWPDPVFHLAVMQAVPQG